MHVSINIVTRNDLQYLPELFRTMAAQTYQDVSVRVLDNGSTDGTLEYLQEHHSQCLIARNVRNLGTASGYNQLIRFAMERWGETNLNDRGVFMVSADMILHERMLEELVTTLRTDIKIGAVQPKLWQAFTDTAADGGMKQTVKSDILSTTGLILCKTWHLKDRGAGEIDKGQYDDRLDLIGANGAGVLWRASALKDVMIDGEPFDSSFFTSLEDHDLALRARRAGWRVYFAPLATAHRFATESKTALSRRNQMFLLVKNLTVRDWLRFGFWIFPSQLVGIMYGFIAEPMSRQAMLTSLRLGFQILRQRSQVLALAREPETVIRAYVGQPR